MDLINEVIYTADSGPVLPERQWHERYVINRKGVILSRNGRSQLSEIRTGSWEIPVDQALVNALLQKIQMIDSTTLQRVEPTEIPDGGGTERVVIVLCSGKQVELDYTPGAYYRNGENIIMALRAFVRALPQC